MNRSIPTLVLVALAAAGLGMPLRAAQDAAAGAPRFEFLDGAWHRVEGARRHRVDPEVVSVRFAEGVAGFDDFHRRIASRAPALAGLTAVRRNRLSTWDLRLAEGDDPLAVVEALRRSGLVEVAEVNVFGAFSDLPNDPLFGQQKHLRNSGTGGGVADADIDAELAWSLAQGDPSVVVATLDSGCQLTHVDLAGALWTNPGEIAGNGVDDDGNGFVDDVNGWNFELDSPDVADAISHGTPVAGVVGARGNNGLGVAGVGGGLGAGSGLTVLPVKVATSVISSAIVDDAILYAVDNGARVINMSFMVPQTAAIDQAIDTAHDVHDVVLVAAAGNFLGPVDYPARHPKVLAIAGTDDRDLRWSPGAGTGSSAGPENWISALAEAVWSTALNDNFFGVHGTSFAAPQVAAAAGILRSVLPSLSADDVAAVLRDTADDVEAPGFDDLTGHGRLNLYAAVLHVASSDCNGNGLYDPREIADGLAQDVDGDGVPDDCVAAAYCFGNRAACTPCPCGNAAPRGARAGCGNSGGAYAALLVSGSPSVSNDTLRFDLEGAAPGGLALLCSAERLLPASGACPPASGVASPLLDGLRCIGGKLLRHGARTTDATGQALTPWDAVAPPGGLALDGGFVAGEVRSFQVFYLDAGAGGCGGGVNTSNAVRVEFVP